MAILHCIASWAGPRLKEWLGNLVVDPYSSTININKDAMRLLRRLAMTELSEHD